ncbi:MAG: glycosyltransferase family 2 protein [Elusimicrobiota bacterium]
MKFNQGISIIIISFNTKDIISNCIESILNDFDPSMDEIIVVDNASKDGSAEFIARQFPQVNLFKSEYNRGFSFACNRGYETAKDRSFLLFMNGDVVIEKGCLNRLREKMIADDSIGILSPELLSPGTHELIQMSWGWDITFLGEMLQKTFAPKNISQFRVIRSLASRLQKKSKRVPIIAGACMIIRRNVFEIIGMMDEGFELYFEDADICLRCRKEGFFVQFEPEIKVFHGLGQSGKDISNKIELIYRQSQIHFYRKHNNWLELKLLKAYLWGKFFTKPNFWRDHAFRYWMIKILTESSHLNLEEDIGFKGLT